LLGAWGADVVVVETVGAGQSETAIASLATCTVVVCPPGLGDDMQAIKAGLMEVADVFVVNKADRPGADATAASLVLAAHGPRDGQHRPVLRTVATSGVGTDDLIKQIDEIAALAIRPTRRLPDRSVLLAQVFDRATEFVKQALYDVRSLEVDQLVDQVRSGKVDVDDAARSVLAWAGPR
jgi:LAO/AO transport system kinase